MVTVNHYILASDYILLIFVSKFTREFIILAKVCSNIVIRLFVVLILRRTRRRKFMISQIQKKKFENFAKCGTREFKVIYSIRWYVSKYICLLHLPILTVFFLDKNTLFCKSNMFAFTEKNWVKVFCIVCVCFIVFTFASKCVKVRAL